MRFTKVIAINVAVIVGLAVMGFVGNVECVG